MTEAHPSPRIEDLPDGTRRIVTAVRCVEGYDIDAFCLGRVYIPLVRGPVVILSEVRNSQFEFEVGIDFSVAPRNLVALLAGQGVKLPESTIWYKHVGPFSGSDMFSETEMYTRVTYERWEEYGADTYNHHPLAREEVQELLASLPISPVEEDIASMGL